MKSLIVILSLFLSFFCGVKEDGNVIAAGIGDDALLSKKALDVEPMYSKI